MAQKTFNIKLDGPGITIKHEISEEIAQQIALLVLTGTPHPGLPGTDHIVS